MMGGQSVTVSVVMPVYNEEKYIDKCIQSLLMQDYPQSDMEWIFVDGCSTDKTKEIIHKYRNKYPALINLYDNKHKTVPYAMNIGISQSNGKYIVRLDAHSEYSTDYISKCVYYLDTTDADNVGGVAETKSKGEMGQAIALMLSSKFGVGNSQFRTNGSSGYVDTVPFGAFRREVFSKYGGYDERLTRNQDNEMNFRIRKNGGKIYLSQNIKLAYYCRDTLKGITEMARTNGRWNVITMKLCPGSMGIRHFVPLALVLSLITLGIGSIFLSFAKWLLLAEILLYILMDVVFSLKQTKKLDAFFRLLYLFPMFHISYGLGSIEGLANLFSSEYTKAYTPPKV
ncbi:MAG: glycosyltransferase family 2 protein [Oscillospiraceae bacterium]|nr:glycosyltransferase family 2 protein [Oscillospiraceae bacterium]